MICKCCGKEIPEGGYFCPECGAEQHELKFCKHCGERIPADCVVCPKCGRQVEQLKTEQPQVVIHNTNTNVNTNTNTSVVYGGRPRNKWVGFLLCLLGGYLGLHKFYEGKIGMGIVYLITGGIFGIGWIINTIGYLFKPNPYYV